MMGTDCRAFLPGNVQLSNVSTVIGILLGLPIETKGQYKRVKGISHSVYKEVPELVTINLLGDLITGEEQSSFFYHFECKDKRLVSGRCYSQTVAISVALVDFFGGRVDFNDCDEEDCNFFSPEKSNDLNCPSDDPEWSVFQDRLYSVEPLTKEDLMYFARFARYDFKVCDIIQESNLYVQTGAIESFCKTEKI